jgi:isochorismate synthase EntC
MGLDKIVDAIKTLVELPAIFAEGRERQFDADYRRAQKRALKARIEILRELYTYGGRQQQQQQQEQQQQQQQQLQQGQRQRVLINHPSSAPDFWEFVLASPDRKVMPPNLTLPTYDYGDDVDPGAHSFEVRYWIDRTDLKGKLDNANENVDQARYNNLINDMRSRCISIQDMVKENLDLVTEIEPLNKLLAAVNIRLSYIAQIDDMVDNPADITVVGRAFFFALTGLTKELVGINNEILAAIKEDEARLEALIKPATR